MKKNTVKILILGFVLIFYAVTTHADDKAMHKNASKTGAYQGYRSSRWAEYSGDSFSYYYHKGFEAHMMNDLDKAIELYSVAAKIRRRNTYLAYANRAQIYFARGEYDLAIADYTKVLELKPSQFPTYLSRGNVWLAKKNPEKAAEDFTQAINANPHYAPAYVSRGRLLASQGKSDAAYADFSKALTLDDKSPLSLMAMAWFLSTCPEDKFRNGTRAIELSKNAIELTRNWEGMIKKKTSPEVTIYQRLELAPQYDVLAAAYAESGNFTEAIVHQEKAISLLEYENAGHYLPLFSERLKFYNEKKPWRNITHP